MKSVVRIQGQGKLKDVGLRGLATVPAAESVDSTVALIQALIPVGLKAVAKALADEVTRLRDINGILRPPGTGGQRTARCYSVHVDFPRNALR